MKICSGDNIFSAIFNFIEFFAIVFICLLIFRNIVNIFKFRSNLYDKIDIIVMFLTVIQLIIIIFQLFENYFIFSLLISILKFSQNILICSLLLVIVLWKHSNITRKIINYFMISLLITNILIFLFGISYYNPLDKNNCESTVNIIIVILSLFLNVFIGNLSYHFKINNNIIDNNKKSNIISDYNDINEQINEGEELFINRMYNQYLTNIRNTLTMYLLILFPFFLSYLIEFIFYFFFSNNIIFENEENKDVENAINDNVNTMYFNGKINKNVTYNSCELIRNYGKNFNFVNFILCLFGFIIRDFLPHFCVYVVLFKYKIKNSTRSSF